MTDLYQATFDAVRSKIGNGNIGDAVSEAMRQADIGHYAQCAASAIAEAVTLAAREYERPSAVYRPTLGIDGNQWCALYGPSLMEGVAGFGDTPAKAMADFDSNWLTMKPAALAGNKENNDGNS